MQDAAKRVPGDADAFKQVADELGLNHRVCKKHVERNTEALIESLKPQVKEDKDGSLETIKVSPEQAIADLDLQASKDWSNFTEF